MTIKRKSCLALSGLLIGSLVSRDEAQAAVHIQDPDDEFADDDYDDDLGEDENDSDLDDGLGLDEMTPAETDAEPEPAPVAAAQVEAKPEVSPFKRLRPRKFMAELGIYGGILTMDEKHEFFDQRTTPPGEFREYPRVMADVGLRIGILAGGWFGVELETSIIPTKMLAPKEFENASAVFWNPRGHLLFQIPAANLVPFVLAGAGTISVTSKEAKDMDTDLAVHFGGGLKLHVHKRLLLRVDVRDVVTHRRGDNNLKAHNLEALFGMSLVFGPKEDPPPPPPPDSDQDGILDRDDDCPTDAENFNEYQDEDGCPETDRDGDGFWDFPDEDACPDEAGIEPDGCPERDNDSDGILNEDDACPDDPETVNGHEDSDGCPDEVPQERIEEYSGAIDGIQFENNSANIKPESAATLDRALALLEEYHTLTLEIVGHTDSRGNDEYNLDLSQQRADSVRDYFMARGVDGSRLSTRGVGESEPVASNKTRSGRAQNRRIEFHIAQ